MPPPTVPPPTIPSRRVASREVVEIVYRRSSNKGEVCKVEILWATTSSRKACHDGGIVRTDCDARGEGAKAPARVGSKANRARLRVILLPRTRTRSVLN